MSNLDIYNLLYYYIILLNVVVISHERGEE